MHIYNIWKQVGVTWPRTDAGSRSLRFRSRAKKAEVLQAWSCLTSVLWQMPNNTQGQNVYIDNNI